MVGGVHRRQNSKLCLRLSQISKYTLSGMSVLYSSTRDMMIRIGSLIFNDYKFIFYISSSFSSMYRKRSSMLIPFSGTTSKSASAMAGSKISPCLSHN